MFPAKKEKVKISSNPDSDAKQKENANPNHPLSKFYYKKQKSALVQTAEGSIVAFRIDIPVLGTRTDQINVIIIRGPQIHSQHLSLRIRIHGLIDHVSLIRWIV